MPIYHRLLAIKRKCRGKGVNFPVYVTRKECATICKEKASFFAYGTNHFSKYKVNCKGTDNCRCRCETSAKEYGTCRRDYDNNYLLYTYRGIICACHDKAIQ